LKEKEFAVLILAINLPNSDSIEICKFIKTTKEGCSIILMLNPECTKKDSVFENLGVTDYVTKPFRFSSLLRLVMLRLQKHDSVRNSQMTIGNFTFNPTEKTLLEFESKKIIRLTAKEVSILKYLFAAKEKVVERDVLLNEVWGYNSGISTHTLETHIYRLRQKVEPNPSNPRFLITEEGGYLLTN